MVRVILQHTPIPPSLPHPCLALRSCLPRTTTTTTATIASTPPIANANQVETLRAELRSLERRPPHRGGGGSGNRNTRGRRFERRSEHGSEHSSEGRSRSRSDRRSGNRSAAFDPRSSWPQRSSRGDELPPTPGVGFAHRERRFGTRQRFGRSVDVDVDSARDGTGGPAGEEVEAAAHEAASEVRVGTLKEGE